jgi:hypothetical protein
MLAEETTPGKGSMYSPQNPADTPTAHVDDRGGSGLDYGIISVLQTSAFGASVLIMVGKKTTGAKNLDAKEK